MPPMPRAAVAARYADKVGRAVVGGGAQLLHVGAETVNRTLGAPGFVANLAGRGGRKRMRVCAVILSAPGDDGAPRPLASEEKVREELGLVDEIFKRQANTELFFDEWPKVVTLTQAAPAYALDVRCGTGSWTEDMGDAGVYFRSKLWAAQGESTSSARGLSGYGEPIAVFVVRDVAGKAGCSLGPLSDYVTVDRVRGRLIAHELGHCCGLWHVKDAGNLMLPAADKEEMTRAQQAIFRNSRHVTVR
jgi:hypothetical protein